MKDYFSERINYSQLKAKQKEIYNFQKISAHLADYGYTTIKLADDWMGADFIALHFNGTKFLKIQLKGRLTFDKKYINRNIFICFFYIKSKQWYIYPHDLILNSVVELQIQNTPSWRDKGLYHFPQLSQKLVNVLEPYKI